MIPALASIIAAYVIFRCVSVTLNALVQFKPSADAKVGVFVFILLAALFVAYVAITNWMAINTAAMEMPEF
jgi:hypothetical protein